MHRGTAVAHPEPTKAFLKLSLEIAMLLHPPPSPNPTHLQRSLQEVTSQEESFMLDISGYIRERVNQNHAFSRTSLEDCTA